MKHKLPTALAAFTAVTLSLFASACTAQPTTEAEVARTNETPAGMTTAVLGAGCFWCVEAFYERLDGVSEVVSGYAGGDEANPTYKQVAMGRTTHAEVVQVIYDPETITYRELVDFFWTTHDATRSDGVWPDFGAQYRSILLYQNEAERAAIEASRQAYETKSGNKVATDINALDTFYPAEEYHQDYAKRNPNDRYVRGVLNPKLKKLGFE